MADLILRDFFFSPSAGREGGPSVDPEVRQAATSGKGLKVTFAASHAGMVNGNSVMYSPQGMRNSSHTWTFPIPRRMQIHHDDSADPIGQVVSARFLPYGESQVHSDHQDAFLKLRDSTMKDDILSAARLIEDTGVLGSETWKGVGELVLDAIITDASAIEKILDGRYLGISISQRPRQAFCSICEQDWLRDGACEHERGEKDDDSGRNMYLIVGDTRYVEASYVNQPADEFAQTLDTNPVEFGDSVEGTLSSISDSLDFGLKFTLVDSIESPVEVEDPAPVEEAEDADSSGASEDELEEDPASEEELEDAKGSDKEKEEEKTHESDSPDLDETVAKALELLFANESDFGEEQSNLVNEALEGLVEEEDAKLPAEKRKSLPASSFCGPNRSFPVNDCSHYTAAKRLLGRYKGPGDKSRILSCVNSKGKKLGCSGSKGDSAPPADSEETQDQLMCLDCLDDSALSQTYLDCEKLMVARKLKLERQCNDCSEKDAQISDLQSQVPDLEEKIVALRDEWNIVTREHIASEEAHASTASELRDFLVDYVRTAILLSDKERDEEDVTKEVEAMSTDSLRERAKEVDFSETISFVRSGLSREPNVETAPEEADSEIRDSNAELHSIRETLTNFSSRFGRGLAADYLRRQQSLGKVPKELTLAKILGDMAE